VKLLVLSYHFPPDPSIGAKRWGGLAKYLTRAGATVHAVSAGSDDTSERSAEGVFVHRVKRRRTLNDVYRAMASHRQDAAPSSGGERPSDAAVSRPGAGATLRRELSLLLSFPDQSRGWALRALGAALRITRAEAPTAIASSGPPHLAHLVASVVASRRGLPHVVDLRDPWATYREDLRLWPGIHTSHLGRFALPKLERFVFRRASMIIANTVRLRDLLRARYPGSRVEWIPNGVDLEELTPAKGGARYPGLSISHTGTLYGGRTLESVMDAFAAFLRLHPEAREVGSRLRAAGPMEEEHAQRFWSRCGQLGLEDAVEHLGVVPQSRADELAHRSSLCLVLAQGQHLQVPGKIYELTAMGCSVLVVSEPGSASADEAQRLGVRLASDDPASLLKVLEDVWVGAATRHADGTPRLAYQEIALDVGDLIRQVARSNPA